MTLRILPAAGDQDAARVLATLLAQLPDAEPAQALPDSTALLDTLAALAAESLDELPEVVLVHERMGPAPALDLVREVTRRFPSVGVVLLTTDTGTAVITAAMDAGARGIVALPMSYEALAERVQAAAVWSLDMRRHLATGSGRELLAAGGGGRVVTVSGAKGGVGTTLTAVQLALAAQASGRSTALLDLDLQSGDTASYLDVQFRRSVADLAAIRDVTPRVLADVVFTHESGLAVIPAPAEGERGEDVTDRTARQVVTVLRGRYDVVIVDCGTQMAAANAAAVELADEALLVLTPDVVAVRAAKRQIRLWERLQIRKAEETTTVVNRYGKGTEINPALVARITGTRVARTTVPAHYRELQSALDAGRVQDLDAKSTVKQALWGSPANSASAPANPTAPPAASAAAPTATGAPSPWSSRGSSPSSSSSSPCSGSAPSTATPTPSPETPPTKAPAPPPPPTPPATPAPPPAAPPPPATSPPPGPAPPSPAPTRAPSGRPRSRRTYRCSSRG